MMESVKYNFYKIFINLTPFYFCYYIIYRYNERNIMLMDYLDFSEQNEDTNHEYLLLFQEDLENAGLKQKKTSTIIYLMQICPLMTFQVIE